MDVSMLVPGDTLLYSPVGFFGWAIATKTWHKIAHCEVYAGNGHSYASRDGKGVSLYPWRNTELVHVLRPTMKLNEPKMWNWASKMIGTPYGWLELANFVGIKVPQGKGVFCSEFLVEFYRAGGWDMFPEDRADQVAPFEFLNLVGSGYDKVL